MKEMTLDNFEEEYPSRLLEQGFQYYEDGTVSRVSEVSRGAYRTSVYGSRPYVVEVRVESDGKSVELVRCDCPYAEGEENALCKHIAAVLYVLKYGYEEVEKESDGQDSDSAYLESDSYQHETIEDVLARLSGEECRQALTALLDEYPEGTNLIMARYAAPQTYSNKRGVKRIIRDAINSACGRSGIMNPFDAYRAMVGANEILAEARAREQTEPETALMMYQAVVEEGVPALQKVDDSNGDVGDCIREAHARMQTIAPALADGAARKRWYKSWTKEAFKKRYDGWDDPWEFLTSASLLVDEHTKPHFFATVDSYVAQQQERRSEDPNFHFSSGFIDRYDQERTADLKHRVVGRLEGEDAAEDLARSYLDLHNMRERVLECAYSRGELDEAEELADAGVVQSEKESLPGLVHKFRQWLLAIAEARGDDDEVVRIGTELFLDRGNFEYYERLKQRFSGTQWRRIKEQIIESLSEEERYHQFHTLAELYWREKENRNVLELMEQHPDLVRMYDRAELARAYPKRLAAIYETLAAQEIVHTGRGVYEQVRQYLERIRGLGQEKRARELAHTWLEEYPNRPAMREVFEQFVVS
jgi:hypothetical protein